MLELSRQFLRIWLLLKNWLGLEYGRKFKQPYYRLGYDRLIKFGSLQKNKTNEFLKKQCTIRTEKKEFWSVYAFLNGAQEKWQLRCLKIIQSILISSTIYQIGVELFISCYWSISTLSRYRSLDFKRKIWNEIDTLLVNFVLSQQLASSIFTPFQRCCFFWNYMTGDWSYNTNSFYFEFNEALSIFFWWKSQVLILMALLYTLLILWFLMS